MILALFDIDGTILSTRGAGRRAVADGIQRILGHEVDIKSVAFAGRTDRAIMKDLIAVSGRTDAGDEELGRYLDAYRDALVESLRPEDVTVLPGVRNLINRLVDNPWVALGLVTGNLQDTAYRKLHLARLDHHFPIGGFGCDHEDRNMLPAVAARRAQSHYKYDFTSDRTVVIGDTIHDIACSRHFGARSVAVSTGLYSRVELERAQPDLLLDSLDPAREVDLLIDQLLTRSGAG